MVEVVVAMGIFATGLIALAQLFTVATTSNQRARTSTMAAVLADQKMEQLRGLLWGFDLTGLPVSDLSSDVSVVPAASTGGAGLNPSPAGTLNNNVPGYVDYIDTYGTWVGTGTAPPVGTAYVRRWSVEPMPTNPNNTLVLQVLVSRVRPPTALGQPRQPDEARLVSVKTRKSS